MRTLDRRQSIDPQAAHPQVGGRQVVDHQRDLGQPAFTLRNALSAPGEWPPTYR
jgi:hypothetical protein